MCFILFPIMILLLAIQGLYAAAVGFVVSLLLARAFSAPPDQGNMATTSTAVACPPAIYISVYTGLYLRLLKLLEQNGFNLMEATISANTIIPTLVALFTTLLVLGLPHIVAVLRTKRLH